MRFVWSICARLAFAALMALSGPARAAEEAALWSADAVQSIVPGAGIRVLSSGRVGPVSQAIDALERAGYDVPVAVLPGTLFVRPRGGAGALPAGMIDVTSSEAPAPSIAAAPADPFGGRADALPPVRGGSAAGELARRGPLRAPTTTRLPYGARWEDTSEFMMGRVAVPLLFPESDGTFDPDRYDWTPALRDSVIRSAVRGLLKASSLAGDRGVSLTFLLEIHPILPTRYEPIDRPVEQEFLWVEDALEPVVGYEGDPFAMAYDVANAARARLGTQWAALIFAVQNDTDPDGSFPDGFISHAQLGGPWYVVLVNNLNTQSAALDFYMEHEMMHMFWALDEFPANNAWWSCTLNTGYFNQQNSNSAIPLPRYCGFDDRCLMKGNHPDSLCAPTARQVGWVDQDLNGVLDLLETRPIVQTDSTLYHGSAGVALTVRGTASDAALPNRNPYHFGSGDSITVATVDSIWYRIDGEPWIPVSPGDGLMDEGSEAFTLLLPPLSAGNHLLEFQARNSSGLMTLVPTSVPLSISGGSGTVGDSQGEGTPARAILEVGPTPSAGAVRFALRARGGSSGVARVCDAAGRVVRTWRLDVSTAGRLDWDWDGRLGHGGRAAGGVYFLVVQLNAERLTRRIVLLR